MPLFACCSEAAAAAAARGVRGVTAPPGGTLAPRREPAVTNALGTSAARRGGRNNALAVSGR